MVVILLSNKEDDYSAVRACITRQIHSMVFPELHGFPETPLEDTDSVRRYLTHWDIPSIPQIRKICDTVSDALERQLGRVVDLKLVILLIVLIALSE